MAEDLLHLERVSDDGKNAHSGRTAGTDQRVDLVGCRFILHLSKYLRRKLPGSKPVQ
jgi:hypothetical protein